MEATAIHLLLEISRFTAQVFVSGLWQGVVLISVVAVCLRLLSRVSASIRFAIWGLAFALVIAIPLLHLRVIAAEPHAASGVVHLGASWGVAIAGVWVALMVVRAAQLLMQTIRLRRIWRRATPLSVEGATLALLRSGGREAELCSSTDVDSPSVIGFFSPRLLISEGLFEELTESELHQIVLHECEHLRRRDDWMNLLQKVGLALFPLNPALLWVDRRMSLERELACDAGVVASTAAPFAYASCLTRLAEHNIHCRRVALSLSAWGRQSELARRVHSLLRPMSKMSSLQAGVSLTVLSIGLFCGAAEMARVPSFVSFTDVASATVDEAAATTPSSGAMQAMPVVYRQDSSQPHATLLKAVLPPSTLPSNAARPTLPSGKPAMKQAGLRNVHAVRVTQRPRAVLTTVRMQDRHFSRSEIRTVYSLSTDFSPSYAAVPFGDGWLIVQL